MMVPTAAGSLAVFETEDAQLLCQIEIPGVAGSARTEEGRCVVKVCDFEWHA